MTAALIPLCAGGLMLRFPVLLLVFMQCKLVALKYYSLHAML